MKRRLPIILSLCLLAALLLPACSLMPAEDGGALVINEVVSSNRRCLVDSAVGTPDWIELYNGTDEDINLAGYGLSDNVRKLSLYDCQNDFHDKSEVNRPEQHEKHPQIKKHIL